jgi:hypothetical protein
LKNAPINQIACIGLLYKAAADTSPQIRVADDEGEIIISGYYVDTVSRTAPHECFSSRPNEEYSPTDLETLGGKRYLNIFRNISLDWTFIITKSGYIGTGPRYAEAGDAVCVFDGAQTPFVLRKIDCDDFVSDGPPLPEQRGFDGDGGRWQIIGDCYLHGFMDNEVVSPKWQEKRQQFWIV